MKRSAFTLLAIASCLTMPVHALEIWHSSTVWAGQGQCSAVFSFDADMEELENLQVTVSAINKAGETVAKDILEVPSIGYASADRYDNAIWESEEICDDDLTIVVNKATAIVAGKRVDLLKTKAISARDFKPFKIRIGK